MNRLSRKHRFVLLATLILIPMIVFGVHVIQLQKAEQIGFFKPPPVPKEITSLIDSAAQQNDSLPKGETPTVATVTNLSQLQAQAFFDQARNGDKILIYTKARKAFIYRPSSNMIVHSGVLQIVSSLDNITVDSSNAAILGASTSAKTGANVLKVKF